MNNEELFKKYLISLGMNPEWTELAAIMEVIRNKFTKALRDGPKHFRIREKEIVLGKADKGSEITPNIIRPNFFELSDDEIIRVSQKTGMIEYLKSSGKTNLEKREIDPKTGIVMRHIKRFGGNARDEEDDDCYSLVEYKRNPDEPTIQFRSVYKNVALKTKDAEIQESVSTEYDYAYPTEIEKNGTTHRKTPIYFMKRYPRYAEWFNRRFKSRDEYIQNVFAMQKDTIRRIVREQRKSLEARVITYAKSKDKLDAYYSGLQEIFSTNIIGHVYKLFITGKIESIIVNDEFGVFYETGSGEQMLEDIMKRLEQEINPKTIEEIVKREGAIVAARIGLNEDYQVAKETFADNGEVKSVEDEDYSIEGALVEINDKSNIVEDFNTPNNPFAKEIDVLDQKIAYNELQMKILKTAYKAFPKRKKSLKETINEIENQKVKTKTIIPKPNTAPNADGR